CRLTRGPSAGLEWVGQVGPAGDWPKKPYEKHPGQHTPHEHARRFAEASPAPLLGQLKTGPTGRLEVVWASRASLRLAQKAVRKASRATYAPTNTLVGFPNRRAALGPVENWPYFFSWNFGFRPLSASTCCARASAARMRRFLAGSRSS